MHCTIVNLSSLTEAGISTTCHLFNLTPNNIPPIILNSSKNHPSDVMTADRGFRLGVDIDGLMAMKRRILGHIRSTQSVRYRQPAALGTEISALAMAPKTSCQSQIKSTILFGQQVFDSCRLPAGSFSLANQTPFRLGSFTRVCVCVDDGQQISSRATSGPCADASRFLIALAILLLSTLQKDHEHFLELEIHE